MTSANGAAASAPDQAVQAAMRHAAEQLVGSTSTLLQNTAEFSKDKENFAKQQQLSSASRNVNMQIAKLIQASKAKTGVTKKCENAMEEIQAGIHDLDTAAVGAAPCA